jgi:hypothetical protein
MTQWHNPATQEVERIPSNPVCLYVSPKLARLVFCLSAFFLIASMTTIRAFADDSNQRAFPTAQAAVNALITAAKAGDPKAEIMPILGPEGEKILSSGDNVEDEEARKRFVSKYDEMHRLAYDKKGRVILYIGAENWPLPIPLVKNDKGWRFDTAAGEQELVYRRIGANELYSIDVLQNLVEAQSEYAMQMRALTGVDQYAQEILSDEGRQNGLYWAAAPGVQQSPIGPLIARAASEGYKRGQQGQPTPFHGYLYKVLTAQGKSGPGGACNYIRNGRMTGGFAFVAYPASYRSSGVMTFIVGADGIVRQKDLGPDTARLASKMTL